MLIVINMLLYQHASHAQVIRKISTQMSDIFEIEFKYHSHQPNTVHFLYNGCG